TMTVFVTGDYEEKKTVSFSPDNLVHGGVTVEFDGIRAGSKLRVVCLPEGASSDSCLIGVSDEVTIIGGQENAASVKLANVYLQVVSNSGKLYLQDTYIEIPPTRKDLPSCTFSWYYKDSSNTEHVMTTSESECIFTNEEGDLEYLTTGTFKCTIYCNGTRIITLRREVA
ncbi:MAG: hypothetical protein J5817_10255, partial [Treponema sp.]|nr:hypothetical protein [Treponema sp.]